MTTGPETDREANPEDYIEALHNARRRALTPPGPIVGPAALPNVFDAASRLAASQKTIVDDPASFRVGFAEGYMACTDHTASDYAAAGFATAAEPTSPIRLLSATIDGATGIVPVRIELHEDDETVFVLSQDTDVVYLNAEMLAQIEAVTQLLGIKPTTE